MVSTLFVLFSYIVSRFMKISRPQGDKIDIKRGLLCTKELTLNRHILHYYNSTSFMTLRVCFTPTYALSIDLEDGLCLSRETIH